MTDSLSPSAAPTTRDAQLLGIYGRFMRAIRRAYHEASWTAVNVALGAFKTECDTLPPLDEPKVIQSASPLPDTPGVSDPKLKELIDAHQNAAYHISEVARRVHTKEEESEAWGRMDKSRTSLEDYFRTLQRENERLKAGATSFLVTATERSTARTESPMADQIARKEVDRLSNVCYVLLGTRDPEKVRDWINRAYQTALTPQEAKALRMDVEGEALHDFVYADWQSGKEKLRLISGTPK